jgi:Spy/CpxP family protein refolding chaperone
MRREFKSLVVALALSSSAWSVSFSQGNRLNPVGQMPLMRPAIVLRSNTVRRELKFTEEQEQKADAVFQTNREARRVYTMTRDDILKKPAEERNARHDEYIKLLDAIDREAIDIMTDEQSPRFKQIHLQISRDVVLFNAEVIAELKLGSVQTDALTAIYEKYTKKLEQPPRFEGTIEERRRQREERIAKLWKEASEEYFGVLTEEQREQFEKMCGPKFEVDKSEFRE